MKTVLFACVHNAGRSQMAAAWFNALSDPERARGVSAGTAPAPRVHPEVLDVMREVGIDLGGQQPRFLSEAVAREASLLVTMGCGERQGWLRTRAGPASSTSSHSRPQSCRRCARCSSSIGCPRRA
jgi:protein-tyrosine-phosphatase